LLHQEKVLAYSFGVDIGSLLHQQPNHVQLTSLARQVERRLRQRKQE
jgi:hypothetical protein